MSEWFGERRQHAQGHILQRGRFVVGNRIEDDANGDEFLFEQE